MILTPNRLVRLNAPASASLGLTGVIKSLVLTGYSGAVPGGELIALDLSAVTSATGDFEVQGWSLLTSVNFDGLTNVTGNLSIYGNSALTALSFPVLATTGHFNCSQNPVLTSLSLPHLTTTVDFASAQSTSLVDISLPSLSSPCDLDCSGCALSLATVNALLVQQSALLKVSGTINLSGGTNAIPSGAGATAKANLILAGVSVTTN